MKHLLFILGTIAATLVLVCILDFITACAPASAQSQCATLHYPGYDQCGSQITQVGKLFPVLDSYTTIGFTVDSKFLCGVASGGRYDLIRLVQNSSLPGAGSYTNFALNLPKTFTGVQWAGIYVDPKTQAVYLTPLSQNVIYKSLGSKGCNFEIDSQNQVHML